MYPYHNKIKQRIKNGELVGHYFGFRKGIGECLILLFSTEPRERPIRRHIYDLGGLKWEEYHRKSESVTMLRRIHR